MRNPFLIALAIILGGLVIAIGSVIISEGAVIVAYLGQYVMGLFR